MQPKTNSLVMRSQWLSSESEKISSLLNTLIEPLRDKVSESLEVSTLRLRANRRCSLSHNRFVRILLTTPVGLEEFEMYCVNGIRSRQLFVTHFDESGSRVDLNVSCHFKGHLSPSSVELEEFELEVGLPYMLSEKFIEDICNPALDQGGTVTIINTIYT